MYLGPYTVYLGPYTVYLGPCTVHLGPYTVNLMPEIIHIGGEHTVTGSCHLMKTHDLHIMVDCGLAQGADHVAPISAWPVRPAAIDYLFLTHAHIDHIGRLPELIAHGFKGEIICTHPTKALLAPMLQDALTFSEFEKNAAKQILQTIDDLAWGFEYHQTFKLQKGIEFKLGCAGHILGSCFIRFTIPGYAPQSPEQNSFSIIFSGDLGAKDTPILPDPDPPDSCDLLLLESTYGDRLHEDRTLRIERLGNILTHALADKGKVFIPAFSLGRTQELLYELDRLFAQKAWRDRAKQSNRWPVPVFVDSPLGLKITEIYSALSEYWDKEAKTLYSDGDHPIDFDHLYSIARYREHKQLLKIPGPAIIIAGSGMCTGGRIIDHLEEGLEERRNDIFFVGYQAEGTLGRDIIRYSRHTDGYVRLAGRKIPIKAKVRTLSGYSAHADQQGLIDWVESMPGKPGAIKLVHGEPQAQKILAEKLRLRDFKIRG